MTVQEMIDELVAGIRDGKWAADKRIVVIGDIFEHIPLINGYDDCVYIEQGEVAPEDDHLSVAK